MARRSLSLAATAATSLLLSLALLATAATAAGLASPPASTEINRPHRRPRLGPRRVTGVVRRANADDSARPPPPSPDLVSRCRELWRDATLDHFAGWKPRKSSDVDVVGEEEKKRRRRRRSPETFRQRYFVCDDEWSGPGSPIFFYFGNEADVTLYLNATGLMWQSAPSFGAALVFAEHRGYGSSRLPSLRWLTADQAMADYAELISELRDPGSGILGGGSGRKAKDDGAEREDVDDGSPPSASDAAVIGFGGSYGGMLAAWMRLKYPFAVDGAVAASAPIWAFEGMEPTYDPGAFAAAVTDDAGPKGGASASCSGNVREAFAALLESVGAGGRRASDGGSPPVSPEAAAAALRLCPGSARALTTPEAALAVAEWASGAFDSAAMGSYPYPSSYMLNGDAVLPAWPMRAVCGGRLSEAGLRGADALEALAEGVGVYFNATGDAECYDPLGDASSGSASTDDDGRLWGWQYCTQMFMPFGKDGRRDMFWEAPWSSDDASTSCEEQFGVVPSRLYAATQWGGKRILPSESLTNVVFSNGLLDPWSTGGVLSSDIVEGSGSVVVVEIPEGGHHVDLFFSNDADPESVKRAREIERREMRRWVEEVAARRAEERKRGKRRGRGRAEETATALE